MSGLTIGDRVGCSASVLRRTAMDTACDQFQIATCLIREGNRAAAARHLKAALRAIDRCSVPDLDIRAEIVSLLTAVKRTARAA